MFSPGGQTLSQYWRLKGQLRVGTPSACSLSAPRTIIYPFASVHCHCSTAMPPRSIALWHLGMSFDRLSSHQRHKLSKCERFCFGSVSYAKALMSVLMVQQMTKASRVVCSNFLQISPSNTLSCHATARLTLG